MEDIACVSLHEKFPWLKPFSCKFSEGYLDGQDLLKNLKNEMNAISSVGKKRRKELFEVIKYLFLHFWWKMQWKQTYTWKKYWKKEEKTVERNNDSCKVISKLLEFIIYLGIVLSKGNTNSPWIMNTMQVVRLLPDCDDIICTSLLSLSVKKKYHSSLAAVLKSILIFNVPQYVKDPVTFIKIMMLFKKLKTLTKGKKEQISIETSAKKFQAPPCLISWISSFNLDVSKIEKNKVSQQLLKKSSKGLLKKLKSAIEDKETSFVVKHSMSGDNYCHSLYPTLQSTVDSSSAFHYMSDYASDFEDQLKRDVLKDLCCQNKEYRAQDEVTGINGNSTLCDADASIEDCSINTEFISPSRFDEASHENEFLRNQKEVFLKKSVILENSDNHVDDINSPSCIDSIGLKNHVHCDKKETIAKTNKKELKIKPKNKTSIKLRKLKGKDHLECKLITSTPKVDLADICSFKDPSVENESDNFNFRVDLTEKFDESCDIIDKSNNKNRKRECDKNISTNKFARKNDEETSVILKSSQVYSDSLLSTSFSVSTPSIDEDSSHDSHLIPKLNSSDETALFEPVSNGSVIPNIKGGINANRRESQGSSSDDNMQKINSRSNECEEFEKSDKFILGTKAEHKELAPTNIKRHKLYNPEVYDNYKLSETESCTSTLDSASADVSKEQQGSCDNVSQYDGQSVLLFDCGSEFGLSDVFSKPDILLDYCSNDVDLLPQEIPETEAFSASHEEIAQHVLNSLIEKVSCLDITNFASLTTNNFNVHFEKMHKEQQLDQTLNDLSQKLDEITAHLERSSTNSSVIDNQMIESGLLNESSFSNDPVSKNTGTHKMLTEIFQPSSCSTFSSIATNNDQWCASLDHNTLTINCNTSDIGSKDSQININPIDSLIPLRVVINFNTQRAALSQRQCSEINFQSSLPRNRSSNNFIHFHGTYSQGTTMSCVNENRTCSQPERSEDQLTEHGSTEPICKIPNFVERSTQEAVIHPTYNDSSINNIVGSISKWDENTSNNQVLIPLWEMPGVDGNQRAVQRDTEDESKSVTTVSSINTPPSPDCRPDNHLVQWLAINYERAENSRLPFSTFRSQYLKYCKDYRKLPMRPKEVNVLLHSVFHPLDIVKDGLRKYFKDVRYIKPKH